MATLKPSPTPLMQATPPGYQHLGTLPAADGGTISIGMVCPDVAPAQEPAPNAVFAGFSQEQLTAAFDKVKDPENWKNPINRTVVLPESEWPVTHAAIAFFTGSEAVIFPRANGKARVRANGYYLTIGA